MWNLHFCFLWVTEDSGSVAIEAQGFRCGLEGILGLGVVVEVATTDHSPSIKKIMGEKYPEITHQFD